MAVAGLPIAAGRGCKRRVELSMLCLRAAEDASAAFAVEVDLIVYEIER